MPTGLGIPKSQSKIEGFHQLRAGFCGQTADGSKSAVICSVATLVFNLGKSPCKYQNVKKRSLFGILVLIFEEIEERTANLIELLVCLS